MKTLITIAAALFLASCSFTQQVLDKGEDAARQAVEQKRQYNDAQARLNRAAICETTLGAAGRTFTPTELAAAWVFCPKKQESFTPPVSPLRQNSERLMRELGEQVQGITGGK